MEKANMIHQNDICSWTYQTHTSIGGKGKSKQLILLQAYNPSLTLIVNILMYY